MYTYKAIVPKGKPLNLRNAITTALEEEAKLAEKGLALPAKTWETQVDFKQEKSFSGDPLYIKVFTTNKVYGYNDQGTPPHRISARRSNTLRFYGEGFAPKTRPGRLKAGRGRKAYANLVYPLDVAHPGTEPRYFAKTVAKNGLPRLLLRLRRGIRNELSKWGR